MAFAAHIVIVSVMYVATLAFVTPLLNVQDQEVPGSIWLLVFISAVANLVVMGYHYIVPPHPKFLLLGWRRLILRLHILSGTVELIAGLVAILSPGNRTAATVMALTALCVHVPTAFGQTPIVFGSRAIMRPGYLLCIGLHAFCAIRLLQNPSSTYWTVATFLIFNVYVWCRLYYYVFDKFGLFDGSRYTVAICAAGLTTIPAVLGTNSILLLIAGSCIYMVLYSMFFIRTPMDYQEFVRERARDASPINGYISLLEQQGEVASQKSARALFGSLLEKDRETISVEDLCQSLIRSGIAVESLRPALNERFGQEQLTFEEFFERIWSLNEIRRHALVVQGTVAAKSDRDKAEFVFGLLDLDHNGYLEQAEFEALTAEWAMPEPEAKRLLHYLDVVDGGRMDFDRFFRQLRPVWRFVYYDVVDAKHGRHEDMLVRAITARREARATQAVRKDLRQELVRHIAFLQGASEDFLDELAASLVETRHPAGSLLFSQGEPGECLYIVRRGTLSVSQDGERLGELTMGDWLGEGALMRSGVRSASASAKSDLILFEMSRASFQFLLPKYPEVAETLEEIHEERRLAAMRRTLEHELLANVPFLTYTDSCPLESLARALRREVISGEIFHEGQTGDRFYLIGTGHVHIIHQGGHLAELGPGAYFGEGALLSGAPRSATAITSGSATLYALERSDFDRILCEHPGFAKRIQQAHQKRERVRSQIHNTRKDS